MSRNVSNKRIEEYYRNRKYNIHSTEDYYELIEEIINILSGNEDTDSSADEEPTTLPEMIAQLPYDKHLPLRESLHNKIILVENLVKELRLKIEGEYKFIHKKTHRTTI